MLKYCHHSGEKLSAVRAAWAVSQAVGILDDVSRAQAFNVHVKVRREACGSFFFSIAARTITALTVMRSGRKLRQSQPKTKANTKHKPTKTKQHQTKGLPKKARNRVKRCETYGIATLKLSNVLLQEVVPNTFRCSRQRCSVPIQLPCIYHTSRSISEKVASSGSGLVSSI